MKYWAYVNNEILGPFEKEKLLALPAWSPSLLICPQTPVGEKTEDWKEASTYPEISAAMASSAGTFDRQAAGAASGAEPQAAHHTGRKSLTPSSVDPVPPRESSVGGIELAVNHLERSDRSPAQASSSFDPISLSTISKKADLQVNASQPSSVDPISISRIGKRAESISPQDAGIAAEPRPGLAPVTIEPGYGIAPQENTSSPAPAPQAAAPAPQFSQVESAPATGGGAPADPAVIAELNRKLDYVSQNAVTRQDLMMTVDPLRSKLEQLGEALSGLKSPGSGREVMDKLAQLETAIADLKVLAAAGAPAAQPRSPLAAAEVKPDHGYFGMQPAVQKEEKRPEPAAGKKTEAIVDQGGKASGGVGRAIGAIGSLIKKLFKFIFVIALLAAVAYVAAILLKNASIFDVAPMLPFKLPLLSSTEAPGAAGDGPAGLPPGVTSQVTPEPQAAPAAQPPVAPDITPEVIYFARYYKLSDKGAKLEDSITAVAALAGGKYDPSAWQAKLSGPDTYDVSVAVPAKSGAMIFSFKTDFAKKTIEAADSNGKAALTGLQPKPAARGRKGRKSAAASASPVPGAAAAPEAPVPAAAKAAPAAKPATAGKPAAKPAAKAPAKTEPEDEYEYVYEDE